MDIFFEWTESKHFNSLQSPQVISAKQCVEYIHEARMDVLFLQLYWMAIGIFIVSVVSLMCLSYKVDSLEKKLDMLDIIEEVRHTNHVKLV